MPKSIFVFYIFLLPLFATSQTADFSFVSSNGQFCNPTTIRFTQNCTGNPIGFVWDFGNNTRGYTGDLSVTYTRAGTFTVKLIAIYEQNTIEVSKSIVINPKVTASIGYDKNYICKPGVINFTGITSGNTATYAWDFGDTTGTVTSATRDTPHDYVNFGNYTVSLKATDVTGCEGVAKTTIKVVKPPIVATVAPSSGCIPANVNFNSTITVPANDFITSYNWNFGDGTPPLSTTTKNTSHSYTAIGFYSPTLNIITNDGCTNSYNYSVLTYGTPPVNHIAYPKQAIVCGSDSAVFVAKATNANRYIWNFGDGSSATVSDTVTRHKYSTLGIKTVVVTPFYNGCTGTRITFRIEVTGVIASATYSNSCNDKKTYTFNNTSQGNLSAILWNFGDQSTDDTTRNTVHTFPISGQFNTTLKITDSITGCTDATLLRIYTAAPLLVNSDSSICKNDSTSFSIENTYNYSATTYTWNIVGKKIGPRKDSIITVKADTLGNFNNFVSINYGPQGCPDTLQLNHSILVRGPDLSFGAPAGICFNTLYNTINTSKPFVATDSVVLWSWNFGNTVANDTIYQPAPFLYKNPGSYKVKLIGVDINGCQDSLVKNLAVNPIPFLRVIPHTDTLCLGQPDTLNAFSSDNVMWSPLNGISCADCDTVIANPSVTTQYIITATTPNNCTAKDSVLIKVYTPFTVTAPLNNFYICPTEQAQLDVDPKTKKITWSPTTGLSNSTIYNPTASPLQSTVYTATLSDSVGCFSSSTSIDVVVKSLPTVDAGPDRILPYNSSYTITPVYSNNISEYAWSPSSLLSCSDCAAPGGVASYSETYTIKVTSDSGCKATDNVNIFVECKYANIFMPNAFTPNNDNLNDFYYPITRGIKTVSKFAIYNRQGKLIYIAENFPPNSKTYAWNGQFKGENQPAGAYVYVMQVVCELGEKLTKNGSFLLLR